ncbi:MAG: hypothetical protein AB7O96_13745 [Pseudobdellovibrionaceae bacterium]
MSIEKFLHFFIPNNVLIIEIIFVLVIVGVIFVAVRTFLGKDEEKSTSNLAGIEESLKKVLEQSAQMPHTLSGASTFNLNSPEVAAAGVTAGLPPSAGEAPPGTPEEQVLTLLGKVQNLERELKEKEQAITATQTTAAAGGAPASGGISTEEKRKLEDRIRELEGRLAEYEIIEEDIADLSHYKEENKILSDQLAQLRAQLEEASKVKPAPAIVDKKRPEPVAAPEEDPVMNDFSEAVKNQDMGVDESDVTRAVPESAVAQVVPEVVSEPVVAAAPEPAASEDPLSGSINMDRMLEETQDLGDGGSEEANALDQSMDESKLLAEAAELETGTEKQDAELMNQFENFVEKKG